MKAGGISTNETGKARRTHSILDWPLRSKLFIFLEKDGTKRCSVLKASLGARVTRFFLAPSVLLPSSFSTLLVLLVQLEHVVVERLLPLVGPFMTTDSL